MILVSVGTQFSFDRLVEAVDKWAIESGCADVVAQVGDSTYQPKALECVRSLDPDRFAALHAQARLIVAHAGMGSILGALQAKKPIIIMPREHARGEHRNDHQLATARRFESTPGVYVAWDAPGLVALLGRAGELSASEAISPHAPEPFLASLRAFAENAPTARLPLTRRWWIRRRRAD